MYITLKKVNRKVKSNHSGKVLDSGELYLQVNNGTIGMGCRTFNISLK